MKKKSHQPAFNNLKTIKESLTKVKLFWYQGSFDHVKFGPTPVLESRNLWRQIHIFLDILEFRVENKIKYFEKTVLVMWSQTCGKTA